MITSNKSNSSPTTNTTTNNSNLPTINKKECNIQVAVRLRGKSPEEVSQNAQQIIQTDQLLGSKVNVQIGQSDKTYYFDKVFGPKASQITVFKEIICPMISEVLTGYNCTVFAYGQTGTGKTYTMTGKAETKSSAISLQAGIIPRTIHKIFDLLENSANKEEYLLKISFIEIYNEELKDLLYDSTNGEDNSKRLRIFEDATKKGSVVVNNVEEVVIKNANEGIEYLNKGIQKRVVAQTKYNQHSSRSHSIFTITVHIKETNAGIELLKTGKFNLVDLAGSENIGRSGAENQRKREAGMINQSLLTLGRVINSLVDYCPHIPYRESKLTRLLQDSLGGKTKTCVIATISPSKNNLEETMSTLEYANRAKNIRNKPEINQKMAKKELIKEYTNQIDYLKLELEATREKNGVYMTHEQYKKINSENAYLKESIRLANKHNDELQHELSETSNKLSTEMTKNEDLKKEIHSKTEELDHKKSQLKELINKYKNCKLQFYQQSFLTKEYQKSEAEMDKLANEFLLVIDKSIQDIELLHSEIENDKKIGVCNTSVVKETKAKMEEFAEHIKDVYNHISTTMYKENKLINEKILTKTKDQLIKTSQDHHTQLQSLMDQIAVVNKNLKSVNSREALSFDNNQKMLDILKKKIETENTKNAQNINKLVHELISCNKEHVAMCSKRIGEQKVHFETFISKSHSEFIKTIKKNEDLVLDHHQNVTLELIKKTEEQELVNKKLNNELRQANENIDQIKKTLQDQVSNLINNAFSHTSSKFNCIFEKQKVNQKTYTNNIINAAKDSEKFKADIDSLNKEHKLKVDENSGKAFSSVLYWNDNLKSYNNMIIAKSEQDIEKMHQFYKETVTATKQNEKERDLIESQFTSDLMQENVHERMLLEEMSSKITKIKSQSDSHLISRHKELHDRSQEAINTIEAVNESIIEALNEAINIETITKVEQVKEKLHEYKDIDDKVSCRKDYKHTRKWELVDEEQSIKKFKLQYNINDDNLIRKRKSLEDNTDLIQTNNPDDNKNRKT